MLIACLASTANAQMLSRFSGGTPNELEALLEDVEERSSAIPDDDFHNYAERQWVNEQLAQVRRLQTTHTGITTSLDGSVTATLEVNWRTLQSKMTDLDATQLRDFLETEFEPFWTDFFDLSYRNDLELLDTFEEIVRILLRDPLGSVFTADDDYGSAQLAWPDAELPANQADAIVEALQGRFSDAVDAFLTDAARDQNDAVNRSRAAVEKLQKLQSALLDYRRVLTENLRKAETKTSLTSNLYLMILVIGGLSILAIATVRWFPESVMLEWVESGQVIQFVTVMILLSAIMALGLTGLLTENTLGTLLGGIGGYVLSQGVGRTAARRALREQERLRAGKKRCQVDFSGSFLGRPRGRTVVCRASRLTVRAVHTSPPYGRPRRTLRRNASSSACDCGRPTRLIQSRGGSTGHRDSFDASAVSRAVPGSPRRSAMADQRQSRAASHRFARSGLRST